MTDRGQSELLGFVFVFSIVLLSVLLISTVGFSALGDARNYHRSDNVEQAFDVLSANVDAVVSGDAPSRATEMQLSEGQLVVGEPVTITINGSQVSDSTSNFSHSFAVRPIVYQGSEDMEITYVAGATIRDDRRGARMVDEPEFIIDTDQTVINIIELRSPHLQSVGNKRALIRTSDHGKTIEQANTTRYAINITVASSQTEVWYEYLDSQPNSSCLTDGSVVRCNIVTDRVYLSVSRVSVEIV